MKNMEGCSLNSDVQKLKVHLYKEDETYTSYKVASTFGKGHIQIYQYKEFSVSFYEMQLLEEALDISTSKGIELSYLVTGEQIISYNKKPSFPFESLDTCYFSSENIALERRYLPFKKIKEIRVKISREFIDKHKLYEFESMIELSDPKVQVYECRAISSEAIKELENIYSDSRKGVGKRLFLESKVLALLLLQIENKKDVKSSYENTTEGILKKLYQAQAIVSNDLIKQYSIVAVAKQIGMNEYELKKHHKRVFGQSLSSYANTCRLDKAKSLLQNTAQSIYEIAEAIGYKNATHFSATFKNKTGMSPKKFREKISNHQTQI